MANKKNSWFFSLLIGLIVLGAKCQINNAELITVEELEGQWEEQEDPTLIQFAGTNYSFHLLNDKTFQLQLRYWTDELDQSAPCPSNRTDHIIGAFEMDGDQMLFSGYYTDTDFSKKEPNCKGEKKYSFESEIELIDQTLFLTDTRGQRIKLVRI